MAQSKYYNTGGGVLYFTSLVDGVLGTETEFGGTENVAFSSEIETLEHDNTEGAVIVEDISILKKITGSLAIDSIEISPAMLTKAFLGTDFTANVGADGTLPVIGTVVLDQDYPLSLKYLTITSVTAGTAGVLALDDDYTITVVNDVTTITIITGGVAGTGAGESITIVSTNLSYDDIRIEAFLQSKIEGQLRFVSAPANGVAYTYTFHKVSLLASGDFALKSAEEFTSVSFEGKMLASELITAQNESKLFVITGTELA